MRLSQHFQDMPVCLMGVGTFQRPLARAGHLGFAVLQCSSNVLHPVQSRYKNNLFLGQACTKITSPSQTHFIEIAKMIII